MKNLLVLIAFLAACGGHNETTQQPTTPPPATTADQPKPADKPAAAPAGAITSDDEYISKGSGLITKMVDIFKADGANCDKLADDLDKLHDEVAPLDAYDKDHPDVKAKFEKAVEKRQNEMMSAMGPAMQSCANNEHLGNVMAKYK